MIQIKLMDYILNLHLIKMYNYQIYILQYINPKNQDSFFILGQKINLLNIIYINIRNYENKY